MLFFVLLYITISNDVFVHSGWDQIVVYVNMEN